MGSHKMFTQPRINPTAGLSMESKAVGAPAYSGVRAGQGANKDIAAAVSMYRNSKLRPTQKTAATDAPGPKKV